MTSSAIQTDRTGGDGSAGSAGSAEGGAQLLTRHLSTIVLSVLSLGGAVMIFHANRWHVTPPTVFLSIGWIAVVLTARYMWQAAWSAADVALDDEDYWLPVGKQDELIADKRSLLKAIKEIEFDREMGKLSERDADDMTRYYRRRAIEVIKAIESLGDDAEGDVGTGGAGSGGDVAAQIAREVKARLAVAAAADKGKKAKKKAEKVKKAEKEAEDSEDAEDAEDAAPAKQEAADEAPDEAPSTEASDA